MVRTGQLDDSAERRVEAAVAGLIGIGVGTWSSVLVVTPLLVAFEGDRRRPATKVPARPAPRPVARARSKR